VEDLGELNRILGQHYHVVVGNPPYITVKDRGLNQAYRDRFTTCHRQYSWVVPFTEQFFDLALYGADAKPAEYVGMITANSFMKREFGKKLIEEFFPRLDLTHVNDTSGTYIPPAMELRRSFCLVAIVHLLARQCVRCLGFEVNQGSRKCQRTGRCGGQS
jgi:hypothetical protein